MSSHREAPQISKDPVADNTDVYAFVSPDDPGYVTLIANFIPLQIPDSGPNFWEFGDDVVYRINVMKRGSGYADLIFEFRFTTTVRNKNTFLYNTGQIKNVTDTTWNRPQTYTATRYSRETGEVQMLGSGLTCPPVNVGQRSTPDYGALAAQAVHQVQSSSKGKRFVFAGQRADAFHVDLGSVFDLGTLRPFQSHHLIPSADAMGINGLQGLNVHTIAIKVAIEELTPNYTRPTDVYDPAATIGVWASALRPKSKMLQSDGTTVSTGALQQVSRLANPLFNELLIPMAYKDVWNASEPNGDKAFAQYVTKPELAGLLPVLYPGKTFQNLAAYNASGKPRADLAAILLTGIPKGVVPGFANYTGALQADMVRLNMAVPPAKNPNALGIIGGDLAGFPNGRRPLDDVATIELRAVAGATIPLVDPSYKPDDAALGLTDGTSNTNSALLSTFPYLGLPAGGSQSTPGVGKSA